MYRVSSDLQKVISLLKNLEENFEEEFADELEFARPLFDESIPSSKEWVDELRRLDQAWRESPEGVKRSQMARSAEDVGPR